MILSEDFKKSENIIKGSKFPQKITFHKKEKMYTDFLFFNSAENVPSAEEYLRELCEYFQFSTQEIQGIEESIIMSELVKIEGTGNYAAEMERFTRLLQNCINIPNEKKYYYVSRFNNRYHESLVSAGDYLPVCTTEVPGIYLKEGEAFCFAVNASILKQFSKRDRLKTDFNVTDAEYWEECEDGKLYATKSEIGFIGKSRAWTIPIGKVMSIGGGENATLFFKRGKETPYAIRIFSLDDYKYVMYVIDLLLNKEDVQYRLKHVSKIELFQNEKVPESLSIESKIKPEREIHFGSEEVKKKTIAAAKKIFSIGGYYENFIYDYESAKKFYAMASRMGYEEGKVWLEKLERKEQYTAESQEPETVDILQKSASADMKNSDTAEVHRESASADLDTPDTAKPSGEYSSLIEFLKSKSTGWPVWTFFVLAFSPIISRELTYLVLAIGILYFVYCIIRLLVSLFSDDSENRKGFAYSVLFLTVEFVIMVFMWGFFQYEKG